MLHLNPIKVAARSSNLSKKQVQEVLFEIQSHLPKIRFIATYLSCYGDLDRKTSLRDLGKTDFFTREIDDCLLQGKCDIAIHSAKDLPEPLREGLILAALTKGVDPKDSLVLREGETLFSLPAKAKIAVSSFRREEAIKKLRPDFNFVDIRGTVEERLACLEKGLIDGLAVAEAALIRLQLTGLNRKTIPCSTVEGQGQLAILTKAENFMMRDLFQLIDSRQAIWQ